MKLSIFVIAASNVTAQEGSGNGTAAVAAAAPAEAEAAPAQAERQQRYKRIRDRFQSVKTESKKMGKFHGEITGFLKENILSRLLNALH